LLTKGGLGYGFNSVKVSGFVLDSALLPWVDVEVSLLLKFMMHWVGFWRFFQIYFPSPLTLISILALSLPRFFSLLLSLAPFSHKFTSIHSSYSGDLSSLSPSSCNSEFVRKINAFLIWFLT
jgi:hypothetical protein